MSLAKRPKFRLFLLLILASLVVTACGTSAPNESWPGMTADDQFIYVAYGPAILGYDVANQQEVWRYSPAETNPPFFAPPSVQDGRIIIGDYGVSGGFLSPSSAYTLYGLEIVDNRTVSQMWTDGGKLATDRYVGEVTQVDDVAYVPTSDFAVLAVDANTGRLIWRFEAVGAIWSQPVYYEGTLYVTSLGKSVYALNAETGDAVWQTELDGAMSAAPVLNPDAGLLYAGNYDNKLHALDMVTGAEKWVAEAANWIWNAPALNDGRLYYADNDGFVYAVDALDGSPLWEKPAQVAGPVQASPVYANGRLYIASTGDPKEGKGVLVALDAATGLQQWQQTTDAPLFTTPVIVDNVVVVALGQIVNDLLIAYDLESGNQQWSYNPTPKEEGN